MQSRGLRRHCIGRCSGFADFGTQFGSDVIETFGRRLRFGRTLNRKDRVDQRTELLPTGVTVNHVRLRFDQQRGNLKGGDILFGLQARLIRHHQDRDAGLITAYRLKQFESAENTAAIPTGHDQIDHQSGGGWIGGDRRGEKGLIPCVHVNCNAMGLQQHSKLFGGGRIVIDDQIASSCCSARRQRRDVEPFRASDFGQ
ncbi:MAG: hypothetical protein P8Y96_12810 [Desulfuromonadales bacterium]